MTRSGRIVVASDLRGRIAELVGSTLSDVQDAVPAYRNLDGQQLADVQAITGWVIQRMLHAWEGQPGFDHPDLARFQAIGAARAEDGRPLASVLRAYRIAAISIAAAVRAVGGDRLDLDDLSDLSTVLLTGLDELSEALIAGHTTFVDRLNGSRDRARRDLLEDLLFARQSSSTAAEERGRQLGVELAEFSVLIVAESADSVLSIGTSAIDTLISELFPQAGSASSASSLCTVRGRRAVLLLRATDDVRLDKAFRTRGWHGCVFTDQSISDLASSYRLASNALDSSPGNAFHAGALLNEGDAQLLALLTAKPVDPAVVVDTILGPLVEASNHHVLDGLAAYLATGSATGAANQLQLHPQTLRYRLRRAHELTGRDPAVPWNRLALDVARQLHQLQTRSS